MPIQAYGYDTTLRLSLFMKQETDGET